MSPARKPLSRVPWCRHSQARNERGPLGFLEEDIQRQTPRRQEPGDGTKEKEKQTCRAGKEDRGGRREPERGKGDHRQGAGVGELERDLRDQRESVRGDPRSGRGKGDGGGPAAGQPSSLRCSSPCPCRSTGLLGSPRPAWAELHGSKLWTKISAPRAAALRTSWTPGAPGAV